MNGKKNSQQMEENHMVASIVKTVVSLMGKVLKFGVVVLVGAVGAVAAHDYLESRKLESKE